MSQVFVDTSALYALLVASDRNHARARSAFETLRTREAALVTSSYVLVETYALLGRRVGLEAVVAFRTDFAPLLEVVWVDARLHEEGLDLVLERREPGLTLVDAVSFLLINKQAISDVFAYDRHFELEGFTLVE